MTPSPGAFLRGSGLLRLLKALVGDDRYYRLRYIQWVVENERVIPFDVFLPSRLAGLLSLLVNENAIPVPSGKGNWYVVKLPDLIVDRKIPAISEVLIFTHHGSSRHVDMLKEIYTYEGFVEVEADDSVVVDVGAYVGAFSRYMAEKADAVVAIEPFAAIDDSLHSNLAEIDTATVVPKAAWKQRGTVSLNLSSHPYDNSLLNPDSYPTGQAIEITADTVPNILRDEGFRDIDFLKIDAEGVEPEILQGALDDEMEIEKIAVDAGPERNGEPTLAEVTEMLESHGYECRVKQDAKWWGENVVFARKT